MGENKKSQNKKKGREGELWVDEWMRQKGWNVLVSNHHFKGGEIDRVYLNGHRNLRAACVAEIKTVWLESHRMLPDLFSEVQMRRFLRPHQMRNLYRFGQLLGSGQGWFGCRAAAVHLRVFLVVRFKAQDGSTGRRNLGAPKLLSESRAAHLYSFSPEFVQKGQKTSQIQVVLSDV